MLEHIVKNGESIYDILNMYHIELEELKDLNLHITDFYNLASGMKIKVPVINKEIEQILENTESFVQKYYPKVNALSEEKPLPRVEERVEVIEEKPTLASTQPIPPIVEIPKQVEPQPKGRPYPGILPPKNRYSR
ncbi:MAG: LysM domain-containing protein [Anaeroplasmataceae bacterium]|nr:LysM domain-containing protein [Anaeroplasmataceae bacterium]